MEHLFQKAKYIACLVNSLLLYVRNSMNMWRMDGYDPVRLTSGWYTGSLSGFPVFGQFAQISTKDCPIYRELFF